MRSLKFQSFTLVLTSFILGFSEFIIVGILNDVAADFHVSLATIGLLAVIGNLYSGKIAQRHGLTTMPYVFLLQFFLLVNLSFLLTNKVTGLLAVMILGVSMYLINSPSEMFYLQIAEEKYPQSLVLASSFNSIFANFGIALGSGVGSWLYVKTGLAGIGPGGAIFALLALFVNLGLNVLLKKQIVTRN